MNVQINESCNFEIVNYIINMLYRNNFCVYCQTVRMVYCIPYSLYSTEVRNNVYVFGSVFDGSWNTCPDPDPGFIMIQNCILHVETTAKILLSHRLWLK